MSLPIPKAASSGVIAQSTFDIQPPASETWQMITINVTTAVSTTVTVNVYDGADEIIVSTSAAGTSHSFNLSSGKVIADNDIYIRINRGTGNLTLVEYYAARIV